MSARANTNGGDGRRRAPTQDDQTDSGGLAEHIAKQKKVGDAWMKDEPSQSTTVTWSSPSLRVT